MTTAFDRLAELADVLRVAGEQRRVLGDRKIVGIAGAIGMVKAVDDDLVINLRRPALSDAAKQSARDLLDCGVIQADAGDRLFLARMPQGDFECAALRRVLGLYSSHRMSA